MNTMKLLSVLSLSLVMLITSSCASQAQHNELTDEEENEGWTLLFDGESTDRWRGYNKDAFPEEGWAVEEGHLVVLPDGGGGDIITKEKYGNFVLKMEWKVAEGDRKSTRLNSSHVAMSYAVFCLKKKSDAYMCI